jgi:transcription elongation factor Elf1
VAANGAAGANRRTPKDTPLRSKELPDSVVCPFCNEDDTEQFSTFGGQVSTSQYYCNRCRTVFDYFRWR